MFLKKLTISSFAVFLISGFSWSSQDFRIEPGWSHVEFEVKSFGLITIDGHFSVYAGTIAFDESDVTRSTVAVTIQAASIDTGIKKRDEHLRTKDFFETEKYPDISFHSESIIKKGDGYLLVGPLTIKGHTHPVELTFTFTSDKSEDGKPALHAEATGVIDRHDFGLDYGSNFSVGKQIKIYIHIQALP